MIPYVVLFLHHTPRPFVSSLFPLPSLPRPPTIHPTPNLTHLTVSNAACWTIVPADSYRYMYKNTSNVIFRICQSFAEELYDDCKGVERE